MEKLIKPVCASLLLLISIVSISMGCGKTKKYTVVFDSYGGTPVDSQTVKEGECVRKPSDPMKEGFTFVEWHYENATYDFKTKISQDLKLTAFYTINEGTEVVLVAFNADNDTGVDTVDVAKGYPVSEPPTPEKRGYVFAGWYLGDEKFDFSTEITENILLVAKWSKNKESTSNDNASNNKGADKTSNNTGTNSSNTGDNLGASLDTSNNKIKFSDVKGIWYAEGTDDVTFEFSILPENSNWIFLKGNNFDYYTGKIEIHTGRGGTEYFYDNGYFYSNNIKLEGKN